MSKQIKIPLKLLIDVLRLTWQLDDGNYEPSLKDSIQEQITTKLNAMQKREQFTKYKTATVGSDEREIERQAYLHLADINKDFISKKENY